MRAINKLHSYNAQLCFRPAAVVVYVNFYIMNTVV